MYHMRLADDGMLKLRNSRKEGPPATCRPLAPSSQPTLVWFFTASAAALIASASPK